MSTDWGNAFGSSGGSKQAPAPKADTTPAPAPKSDYSQAFGGPARVPSPKPSGAPQEVGLLSDEATEAIRAKAAETGKRLAEGLGKSAQITAGIAGKLGGQGASKARELVAQLRSETVGHNAKVVMGGVVFLAALAIGGIEWHAHRAMTAPTVAQQAAPVAPIAAPVAATTAPAKTPAPVAAAPVAPPPVQPVQVKTPVAQVAPAPVDAPVPAVAQAQAPATQPVFHEGTVASPSAADLSAQWAKKAKAHTKAVISHDAQTKIDAIGAWGQQLNSQGGK